MEKIVLHPSLRAQIIGKISELHGLGCRRSRVIKHCINLYPTAERFIRVVVGEHYVREHPLPPAA